ncbi:MAG: hypothetical protein M3O36_10440 [Myxococcota bacterium]|nr:hypothetical protein [Myxococcota bacterium]
MNRTNDEQQQQENHSQREERKVARRAERERSAQGVHAEDREPRGTTEIAKLKEVGRNLGSQLEEQTRKRPYVVVGAAAGLGFVAGSIFGSRLGQLILAAGLGYAAKNVFGGDLLEEGMGKIAHEQRTKG